MATKKSNKSEDQLSELLEVQRRAAMLQIEHNHYIRGVILRTVQMLFTLDLAGAALAIGVAISASYKGRGTHEGAAVAYFFAVAFAITALVFLISLVTYVSSEHKAISDLEAGDDD